MEKGQTGNVSVSMSMNGATVFYDTKTGKLIKKVEVGIHPTHIVFTQDGKYVLVTNNGDNNVSIIDANAYKLVTNVAISKGPHGFGISMDSKFAYIANMGEDTVSVIDNSTNKVIAIIPVDKAPNGISFRKQNRI